MNKFISLTAVLLGAIAASACGAQDQKDAAAPASTASAQAQGDVCPTASPGPPPTCPQGCAWNGTECRQQGPIVIVDRAAATVNTAPNAQPPQVQPPQVQPPSQP
jgi:hypothetical protein